jgi:hypothetical protein
MPRIDNEAIVPAITLLLLSLTLNVRALHETRNNGTDTLSESTTHEKNADVPDFPRQWTLKCIHTVLGLLFCIEEYDHVALAAIRWPADQANPLEGRNLVTRIQIKF